MRNETDSFLSFRELQDSKLGNRKKVGVVSASLNITNTIIGGGLLEMPYVM